jgi:creatinine amidohydrolase
VNNQERTTTSPHLDGEGLTREVRWERMFPDQLEQAFAECPVVYFPYGLCEPHGPQNAVGLDALKAHAIACQAARAHGGIVAPADFWHIHELGGYAVWAHEYIGQVPRTWLSSVPPWVHFKNVLYHIRAADVLGFHAAIFFTGHYGPNWEDLKTLVSLVQPFVGTRLYGLPEFEANQPGFDGASGDHAGKVETSLLWALQPECVDVSRLPPEDQPGTPYAMGRDAYLANRLVGERMVAEEIAFLGKKAAELLEEYQQLKPQHTIKTFSQAEKLWVEIISPALPEFRCMQDFWEGDPPPLDSIWHANWKVPEAGY